jgi:hypothetical protein
VHDSALVRVLERVGHLGGEPDRGRCPAPVERPAPAGHRRLHAGRDGRAEVGAGEVLGLPVPQRLERLGERAADHALHREVRDLALLPHREDRHDAGVVQARDGFDLAPEPRAAAREVVVLGPDQLERHLAAEARLLREIDDAHPAAAEPAEQAEVAERVGEGGVVLLAGQEAGVAQPLEPRAQAVREVRVLGAGAADRRLALGLPQLETLKDDPLDGVRGSGRPGRLGFVVVGARHVAPDRRRFTGGRPAVPHPALGSRTAGVRP